MLKRTRKTLSELNPEASATVRAVLYVIGLGGFLHLTSLLLIAVSKDEITYFNPAFAVDVDQLFPWTRDSLLVFIFGWALFGFLIYTIRRWLRSDK